MHRLLSASLLTLTLMCSASFAEEASVPFESKRIWDGAGHNAFTDIIRWEGAFYCTFREGSGHVPGENGLDGTIRILRSEQGEEWASTGLLTFKDIDLRDPKLSITPDNRLMVAMGGSNYDGNTLVDRAPYVSFLDSPTSKFTVPTPIIVDESIGEDPGWLWRVTWHEGVGYGVSYRMPSKDRWEVLLVKTVDGIHYTLLKDLRRGGKPNEATVRFKDNGEMFIVVRNEEQRPHGSLGRSKAPFEDWIWYDIPHKLGGPDMIFLPNGSLMLGTREYGSPTHTVLGRLSESGAFEKYATFPSSGDTSYPGFVVYKDTLWMAYYASHEGKTSIYLATIKLKDLEARTAQSAHHTITIRK